MRPIRDTVLSISLVLWYHAPSAAAERITAGTSGEVRFIYLVPSERSVSQAYIEQITFAGRYFRLWLGQQLNGRTYRLADPGVRTVRSDKPARWFSSVERHTGLSAFYSHRFDELARLGVARQTDPQARYMIHVDAAHVCGQSGTGGSGLAVVSANDLRGLSGQTLIPGSA
jgi:hypothetical protein